MLLTEMMVRLLSTQGFSATILSYSDLQSVTGSIRNGLEILKEAFLWRISESVRFAKLDRSTDESAALASAAKVLRQHGPALSSSSPPDMQERPHLSPSHLQAK